jgi:hypothetical protein
MVRDLFRLAVNPPQTHLPEGVISLVLAVHHVGCRIRLQMSGNEPLGGSGKSCVIAESGEPMHLGFLAEPGELALGVATRRLGNRLRGRCERATRRIL